MPEEVSLRGKPAVSRKLLVRGQRVSAIAPMSTAGILDCCTVSSVDGSKFYSTSSSPKVTAI